jgi:hypothetical protein
MLYSTVRLGRRQIYIYCISVAIIKTRNNKNNINNINKKTRATTSAIRTTNNS